ncbi:MAG: T9SS type A sorting domain-containing protein [Bacteroidota bacterium]
MKKIALLFTMMLAAGVVCFAQSLEIYESVEGQDVKRPNGSILTKIVDPGKTFSFLLKVKNVNTANRSVYCKKVYLEILQGSVNSFCWESCYGPAIMVSPTPIVINPQEIITRFDAVYKSYGYSGDSRIRYVWYDGANPNDSVGVEVVFRSHPTGLDDNMVSATEIVASPNPADAVVSLSWEPTYNPGMLTIHNLVGKKILVKTIEGTEREATLNISDFPDGLYFCILESEGKVRAVKKFIIRH